MSEVPDEVEMTEAEFKDEVAAVFETILNRAREEARTTPSWQGLWEASEKNLHATLDEANSQIGRVISNLCDVLKVQFGIEHINHELYDLLHVMPYAMKNLRKTISEEQGFACCADKTRHVFYLVVLESIQKILAEQK